MKLRARMQRYTAAVLALAAMLCASATAESYAAIVTADRMKVYADAERTWQLGVLPATTVVTVLGSENGVAEIERDGRVGYAPASSLTALDSLATRAVANTKSRVYQKPNLSSRWLSLPKGTEVNLLATNGPWAMVEKDGVVAYTNAAHLTNQSAQAPDSAEKPPEVVVENFSAKVTASRLRVYNSASTSSKCLGSMARGTVVEVHAYSGEWAYIELDGNRGFAQCAGMERVAAATVPSAPAATPAPEPLGTAAAMLENGYTVEQVIYAFLTREMKLNTAAACGILANVERECSFNVTAASYDGGYGICQWTGARNKSLKNWCGEHDYDYTTLDGQLRYLQYELENTRTATLQYLKGVENSPQGAYDAAYHFCYNFEIPASRASRSVERGNIAKDKYWRTYAL